MNFCAVHLFKVTMKLPDRGLVEVFWLITVIHGVKSQCDNYASVTFSRWSGVAPDNPIPIFLYTASGNEESLSGACLTLCTEMLDCAGVIVTFHKGSCQGVAGEKEELLRKDNKSSYFKKSCLLRVPYSCAKRWWVVDVTPGYRLTTEGSILKVFENSTVQECYAATLKTYDQKARSAQWTTLDQQPEPDLLKLDEASRGNCFVYAENRFTEPESYRVASYNTLYIENQCHHDYPMKIGRCSYEEYFNQTLAHVETTHQNYTKDQCKSSCETQTRFVCRGFTWKPDSQADVIGICDLHSEDLANTGSWLLRRSTTAIYYRRVICLNLTVECQESEMLVTYRPRGLFRGRVYIPGRGDHCSAQAGDGPVQLRLSFYGDCDVNFAFAVSRGPDGLVNRTMAYVTLMIQNNPIIQTVGDRWVRVGCSPGASANTQVGAVVAVRDTGKPSLPSETDSIQSQAPSAVYSTTAVPLTMYVVRVEPGAAGAVSLGEPLELRIETTEDSEIEVYHLVASSRLGDSSVLLLDSRGCPTGQVDFPQFSRLLLNGTQRLYARFKAFRFPNSHIVRFALVVRSCEGKCPATNCNPHPQQYRSPRQTNDTFDYETELPASIREEAPPGVVAQGGRAGCGGDGGRVPLELEFLVGSRDILSADNLVRADSRAPESDPVSIPDSAMVCMHELLLLALALAWLAVQIVLLLGCCVLVNRYRNLAEMNMQKDYQSFDNVGFDTLSTHRRVHWPDQHLDTVLT